MNLACSHLSLSDVLQEQKIGLDVVAQAFNPSILEAEAGSSIEFRVSLLAIVNSRTTAAT